jgi:hypothetical protein
LDDLTDATHELAADSLAVADYRAGYVDAWVSYQQGLNDARMQQSVSEERLAGQEHKVKDVLNLGAHVFHEYALQQLSHAAHVGRYRVTHQSGGAIEVAEEDF